jgi:diguanylate cyclase (GGDEF)-like protein/PAS domain S-box-containing protein
MQNLNDQQAKASCLKTEDDTTFTNRRSDQAVRAAIQKVQAHFFDPSAIDNVFATALTEIETISNADYAICWKLDDAKLSLLHNESAATAVFTSRFSNKKSNVVNVCEQWHLNERYIFRPRVYNNNCPQMYSQMFGPHNELCSSAFFPVVVADQVRGIIILGKCEGAFEDNLLSRITPLVGSVMCAIQSCYKSEFGLSSLNTQLSENDFLNNMLAFSPSGVLIVENNTIIISNPSAVDIVNGKTEGEYERVESFNGTSIFEILPNYSDLFQWSKQPDSYKADQTRKGLYLWQNQELVRTDGSTCHINLSVFRYSHISNDESKRSGSNTSRIRQYTAIQLQDLSGLQLNGQIKRNHELKTNAIENTLPIGIVRIRLDWFCEFANEKWAEFTGMDAKSCKARGWIAGVHNDDLSSLLEDLYICVSFEQGFRKVLRLVSPCGKIKWVDFQAKPIYDEAQKVYGFVGAASDITEQRNYESHLKALSETDQLTGLSNRQAMSGRLQRAFNASVDSGNSIALMFLDLDGFKYVNDTYGHHNGDDVLKEVASRLKKQLEDEDIVARFGGDEFVILLGPSNRRFMVDTIARRIVKSLAKPFVISDQNVSLSASVGIAVGNANSSNAKELMKQADTALYLAKDDGKNTYRFYDSQLQVKAKLKGELLVALKQGIENSRFELLFQPIVCAQTRKVRGVEALLRFRGFDDKMILPTDFIPLLEETGLIVDVGKWVLHQACLQLSILSATGEFSSDIYMSVNASAKQLVNKAFVDEIKVCCNQYNVDPRMLVVEITETTIINEPEEAAIVLSSLRELGVRTALDDFGTGYSSMTYLQKYAFDILKIDKSFVDELGTNFDNMRIIKAIIALAESFALSVTAEGVEFDDHIGLLESMGVDSIQGFTIGHPMCLSECLHVSDGYIL